MIIYDLEIKRSIPDRNGSRQDGIEYCAGWEDYANMGIACLCVYDMATKRSRVFLDDNLKEFETLALSSDCIAGFNQTRFDNYVLAAKGVQLPNERCYDLLSEIYRKLGRRKSGYKLEDLAFANFRSRKPTNGANAPILWQQGKHGEVIDYCMNDVYLTYRLIDRVINCGYIFDPQNTSNKMYLRKPFTCFAV